MDNTRFNTNTNKLLPTKRLILCSLFAAILCISAYLSIPTPLPMAPKITLTNFVLFLIALLFPLNESFLIVLVWFLLGTVGLPVFIGGGSGVGYLIAPYGAYTWAFPIVAIVLPLIKGKKYNRVWYTICGIIAVLIIDVIGMLYLIHTMNYNLATGFAMGFLPFIPLDIVKAVVVAQIIPSFNKVMA
ncbi:MAG: biotin transporter BioY [Pseudobutyrivibrio sp.]|nr:biotin transporter BioY [Pseudobutyrivibrio sp.]